MSAPPLSPSREDEKMLIHAHCIAGSFIIRPHEPCDLFLRSSAWWCRLHLGTGGALSSLLCPSRCQGLWTILSVADNEWVYNPSHLSASSKHHKFYILEHVQEFFFLYLSIASPYTLIQSVLAQLLSEFFVEPQSPVKSHQSDLQWAREYDLLLD